MKFYDHPNLQQAFEIYVQRQNALLPTREELGEVTFSAAFEQRMGEPHGRPTGNFIWKKRSNVLTNRR